MNTFTKIAADMVLKTAGKDDEWWDSYNNKPYDAPMYEKAYNKVKETATLGKNHAIGLGRKALSAVKKHPVIAALTALGVPGLAAGGYYLTHRDKGDDE